MAKGDKVIVKSEIGGKLDELVIAVESNGGSLEVKTERDGTLVVTVLNRNNKPAGRMVTFRPGAVRSIDERLTRV